jgi:hypothetical protein
MDGYIPLCTYFIVERLEQLSSAQLRACGFKISSMDGYQSALRATLKLNFVVLYFITPP